MLGVLAHSKEKGLNMLGVLRPQRGEYESLNMLGVLAQSKEKGLNMLGILAHSKEKGLQMLGVLARSWENMKVLTCSGS